MSKKDHQKHEQPKKDDKQPVEATASDSMGSEARIQQLAAEVERLRGELSHVRSQAQADLQRDIDRAREDAVAFRKDLVALDEMARGGPGKDMPVTTEMGQRLLKSIQELLRVIAMRREQALADATPETAWASPRARELVEMMAPDVRLPVLGDLLADLARLAGETGAKESAQDVLRRKLRATTSLESRAKSLEAECVELRSRAETAEKLVGSLQAAMVTERNPDAVTGRVFEQICAAMTEAAGGDGPGPKDMLGITHQVIREWRGLREFLSPQPMVAVAVRDDSTPALKERYSLILLEWNGRHLSPTVLEGPARPFSEIVRPMRHAVDTRLVPETAR